jgi:hypothetical protein
LNLSNHKKFFGLSSFEMLAMFRRGLFYAYLSIYLAGGFMRGGLFFVASGAMWLSTLPLLLLPEGGPKQQEKAAVSVSAPEADAATTLFFTLFPLPKPQMSSLVAPESTNTF